MWVYSYCDLCMIIVEQCFCLKMCNMKFKEIDIIYATTIYQQQQNDNTFFQCIVSLFQYSHIGLPTNKWQKHKTKLHLILIYYSQYGADWMIMCIHDAWNLQACQPRNVYHSRVSLKIVNIQGTFMMHHTHIINIINKKAHPVRIYTDMCIYA